MCGRRPVLPGGALLSDALVDGGSDWVYPIHTHEGELDWVLGRPPTPIHAAGGLAGSRFPAEGVESLELFVHVCEEVLAGVSGAVDGYS